MSVIQEAIHVTVTINGTERSLDVAPYHTLLQVLRDDLGLTGTKECCSQGECGSCTVILNGQAVNSCIVLAVEADGGEVTTVEGLSQEGTLSPIQQAFLDTGAVQCGFCTPGMIMSAHYLLMHNPHPTEEEIREGISGNLCRCTGYGKIVEAVQAAAEAGD
jgi:aerobic-type carbon monoxide dehydrogenase small subunit (CoxS/CutS family)